MTMMNEMNKARVGALLAAAAAFAAAPAIGSIALAPAQDGYYGQDAEGYEYESGEGLHEEEWYDPTDWFDDDFDGYSGSTIDYERSWDSDYADDSYYADPYQETDYFDYDGYYDGYNDGYEDDEFGYDDMAYYQPRDLDRENEDMASDRNWNELDQGSDDQVRRRGNSQRSGQQNQQGGQSSDSYNSTYQKGYHDGFYDKQKGHESDPSYYVKTTSEGGEEDPRRSRDAMRDRGDRRAMSSSGYGERQMKAHNRNMNVTRVRGEIESMQKADLKADEREGHLIMTISFAGDKEDLTVDLGPKMKQGDAPFERGDKVTFRGDEKQVAEKDLLVADAVIVGGERYRLRKTSKHEMDRSGEDASGNDRATPDDASSTTGERVNPYDNDGENSDRNRNRNRNNNRDNQRSGGGG